MQELHMKEPANVTGFVALTPVLLTINDFVIQSLFGFLKIVPSHLVPTASSSPADSGILHPRRKYRLRWHG